MKNKENRAKVEETISVGQELINSETEVISSELEIASSQTSDLRILVGTVPGLIYEPNTDSFSLNLITTSVVKTEVQLEMPTLCSLARSVASSPSVDIRIFISAMNYNPVDPEYLLTACNASLPITVLTIGTGGTILDEYTVDALFP